MEPVLSLDGIDFAYGKGAAIRGVTLRLFAGDCYGFLGHNGAGKTTVMRLALGLLRPTRGSVRIFGRDARRDPAGSRQQVGALIERPGFHLQVDARQNLRVLAQLQGLPRRAAVAEADRMLELVGLSAAAARKVGTYSLGMRQRLGIAQALLGEPRLLLLDEPTGGLDPEGIADLRSLLLRLTREQGVAVLVSSHQLAELDGLCNRIGVLRDGALLVEGDLAALRAQLASHYLVRGRPALLLEQELTGLGLQPARHGDELRVDLAARAPGEVLRHLVARAEVAAFAPEPVSLEQIYLRAAQLRTTTPADAPPEAPAEAPAEPTAEARPGSPPVPAAAAPARRPLWRAYGHELRVLALQRSSLLLLVPCLAAAWTAFAYQRSVAHNQQRVARGELFSADAGSGFLAVADALQAGLPLLAFGMVWLASQSIAADHAGDTLRNTLLRPVGRGHVLVAKFAALASTALLGWLGLVAVALAVAWGLFGFLDLEDVSKHGDRQVLADARDVATVFARALASTILPLLATTAFGLLISALVRRPARAIVSALVCLLGCEAIRTDLRERAGWLPTSHLPTGLHDESAIGYLVGIARGAADAHWRFAEQVVAAPLAWLAVALTIAWLAMRRMRIS